MPSYYVTGCDSGFGEILVGKLDKLGHTVFAGCLLQASVERLDSATGPNVTPLRLDVADTGSVAAAAAKIQAIVGDAGLDGVVNNAGILVNPGPVEWTSLDDYRRMFEVNVLGTVSVTISVLPLVRQARGRVVNVASIAGRVALPSQPAYCVSKFGVEAFSDVLRQDMRAFGVTVHIIEPGIFPNTGLYDTFQTGLDRLWDGLPGHLREAYGQEFKDSFREKLGEALHGPLSNKDPSLVPEAMVHALMSEAPKYRYKVGTDAKYLVPVLGILSESTQDGIFSKVKGKIPPPASAPKAGMDIAAARYEKNRTWVWTLLAVLAAVASVRSRLRARM